MGTFGGGWLLARLYKRLHPSLSFYKLWAFWSTLLSAFVALLFALGAGADVKRRPAPPLEPAGVLSHP